jgi:hypothetical protein
VSELTMLEPRRVDQRARTCGFGGEDQDPLAFCVVANITQWIADGDGGLELQRGLRHFPPGAKVWVLPVT